MNARPLAYRQPVFRAQSARGWIPMNYRNTEMKLDQIVSYFNDEKINLSPAFQRGHVWSLRTRRKLMANIVEGKPIPAIFLYKEASGSRYSYNILDGKQRLETMILFIGSKRQDFSIQNWAKYFFDKRLRSQADFWVDLPTGRHAFSDLDDEVVRDLREYAIPTIEINLTDDSRLDEIINLFVDINQQGVQVSRFDIVKAMGAGNKLLKSVFDLIAIKEERQQDIRYKAKSNDITQVLKRVESIAQVADPKAQVDRMWQSLLEVALFHQSKRHRKPVDILKSFISVSREQKRVPALKSPEQKALRRVFQFLSRTYKSSDLGVTTLATDQTRFYTMITSLMAASLIPKIDETGEKEKELVRRLVLIGKVIDGKTPYADIPNRVSKAIKRFVSLASDRTTDTPRRDERQKVFIEAVNGLGLSAAPAPPEAPTLA